MISEAINTILRAHSGLAALVGSQVYPVIAKQGITAPYVVYELDTRPEYTHDGLAGDITTISVAVIAKGYKNANLIANQVRDALELYAGTSNNTEINELTLNSMRDDYFEPEEVNIKEMEFTAHHTEV